MWTEVRRFTSPFQSWGGGGWRTSPYSLLTVWLSDEQQTLASHAHTQTKMHLHGSLIVVVPLSSCDVNVHSELATHDSSQLVLSIPRPLTPGLPLFTHPLCLCFWLALSFAPFILLSLSHPRTHSSLPPSLPVFSLTSPPPGCFGACTGVSRRGWRLIVGWWFGRTPDTGAVTMWECVTCSKLGFQGGCCPQQWWAQPWEFT